MRARWLLLLAVAAAACVPFVGSIDGDRFRCTVDDDCAGDGFVCVAGVCRDPRDLRWPDAGPTDATLLDATPDATVEAGADATTDAATDAASADQASADLAVADHTAVDAVAADTAAADLPPLDRGVEDALVDAMAPDTAASDSGTGDAAGEDAGPADAGEDAAVDAGVDAGADAGAPCTQDSECSATATSFCFSGRCAHLDVSTLTTDLDQVRMPALALVDGQRPAVAYYGYTATASSRKLGYFVHDGSAWQGPATVDSVDDVGADPALAFAPDGRPWFACRKDANDRIRLAYYDGFTYVASDTLGSGVSDYDRAGLAIDGDGTQHLLVRDSTEGLLVGVRRPATPGAIPTDAFAVTPSYLYNMRWPALFREAASGALYATFVNGDRPLLGLVLPELGLVTAAMAPNTQAGCTRLGITSNNSSCTADRPVDLAFDSQGGAHLCTHMKNSSSQARVLYLWLADDGFHGVQLATNSEWDSTYQPGVGCSIVVDALDVPHVFFNQGVTTSYGRLRHVRVPDHVPQTVADVDDANDSGHWPTAVVASDGVLHLAWSRVTARSSNQMSTSTLQVGRLVWED